MTLPSERLPLLKELRERWEAGESCGVEITQALGTPGDSFSVLFAMVDEIEGLGKERDEFEKRWNICRQSIDEQALARADPTMPLLTVEVVTSLRGDAEAAWALAENRDDRVAAHGLSLLCDWQDRARSLLAKQPVEDGDVG